MVSFICSHLFQYYKFFDLSMLYPDNDSPVCSKIWQGITTCTNSASDIFIDKILLLVISFLFIAIYQFENVIIFGFGGYHNAYKSVVVCIQKIYLFYLLQINRENHTIIRYYIKHTLLPICGGKVALFENVLLSCSDVLLDHSEGPRSHIPRNGA